MKKLSLDTLQFEAFANMVNDAMKHHTKALEQSENIVDITNHVLLLSGLKRVCEKTVKTIKFITNSPIKVYNVTLTFDVVMAVTLLGCIIPPENSTYNDRVKQVVIDYCISVLKENDIIPNNPTYTPKHEHAPSEAKQPNPLDEFFDDF